MRDSQLRGPPCDIEPRRYRSGAQSMSAPPRVNPSLFRFVFLAVWFIFVPAVLAFLAVMLLQGSPSDPPENVLQQFQGFVREQPIPAWIVLFTVFEMTLYSFRHSLPLSERMPVAGRSGLPPSVRREMESAAQLLEEAERILQRKEKAVERQVPAKVRSELRTSLDHLQQTMRAEPFDEQSFSMAYEKAAAAGRHLDPWRKGELREYVESIGIAVLVALLLRAVVVEAFKIPSGSMLPTLQINDHIFVNKFVYGPTLPFTSLRVFESMPPKRGDVIVFEFPDPDPKSERQDFIKRVIGLPGDLLEAEGGRPIINGWRVPRCRVGPYQFSAGRSSSVQDSGELYVEFLGEYAYLTLFENVPAEEHQGPYRVKPGEVWVFGDNRNNSSDSRAWFGGIGGGVPYGNIKGRALFVWLPVSRLFVNVMGSPELPPGTDPTVVAGVAKCLQERPPLSETTPPEARQP